MTLDNSKILLNGMMGQLQEASDRAKTKADNIRSYGVADRVNGWEAIITDGYGNKFLARMRHPKTGQSRQPVSILGDHVVPDVSY